MEQTVKDFRYKLQHLGDIFVEAMENLTEEIAASFKGISLTYEIHQLGRKKKKIIYEIGERIIDIRKTDPTVSVGRDDAALELFSAFDKIQDQLEASIMERESRVNGWRTGDACEE